MLDTPMQVVEERTHESRDFSKATQQKFHTKEHGSQQRQRIPIKGDHYWPEEQPKALQRRRPYLLGKLDSTKSIGDSSKEQNRREVIDISKRSTLRKSLHQKGASSFAELKIANDAFFKIHDYSETKRLITQYELDNDTNARNTRTSRIDYLLPSFATPGPGKYNTSKSILKRSLNAKAGLKSLPHLPQHVSVGEMVKSRNFKEHINSNTPNNGGEELSKLKKIAQSTQQTIDHSTPTLMRITGGSTSKVTKKQPHEKDFRHPIELPSTSIYQPPVEASELFGNCMVVKRRAVVPENFAMRELLKGIPRPGGKTEKLSGTPKRKLRILKVTQGTSLDRQFSESLASAANHRAIHKHFFAQLPSASDPVPGPPTVTVKILG